MFRERRPNSIAALMTAIAPAGGISFVGSHVGGHASTSAQTINYSSLLDAANGVPTLQQNDLVRIAVHNSGTTDRSSGDPLLISGYTGIGSHIYVNDARDCNLRVMYKFMGSSPDTTVDIPASDSTSNGLVYEILVLRGVNTTTPLDVSAVSASGIDTGLVNPGAITPVTAGAWIDVVGCAAGSAWGTTFTFTRPADLSATTNHWRSDVSYAGAISNDASIGAGLKTDWSSGAFDPVPFAFNGGADAATYCYAAMTTAFRPA